MEDVTQSQCSQHGAVPLAIVGMACRFAGGITSPEKLWEFVSQAQDAWSEIPESRFNRASSHHPQGDRASTSNIRGGYFLKEDVGVFDTSFFNFTAEVAASMDPQIRMQLELTFEALESAGVTMNKLIGSNTSVYSGSFSKDYHDRLLMDPLRVPRAFVTGNYAAMMANRISHFFDLKGPSTAVDTGCSTSLMGLHLAAQSLRSGESDCAIVGGACIHLNPDLFASLSSLGSCGPDGKCYAFDHRAQGYGRGEGVATLVVKRLDDALRDGDPIRAVIREIGINQDGKTATITSPDGDAQLNLIKQCYEKAGLDPLDTAVVEAHGTGTPAGDHIEAGAIGRAFSPRRQPDQPVYIGSVKTNLGHTEATSGFASLIKMVKALEHGQVPPSINFEKPSPKIDFDGLRLRVPQKLEPWPSSGIRRASINNFGYGGTNAHVILDEADPYLERTIATTNGVTGHNDARKLFLLSARDQNAVRRMAANLCDHFERSPGISFDNLAYTLGQRRTKFPWTMAVTAESVSELADALSTRDIKPVQAPSSAIPRLGFVFNGQGAQWFAMGRELMSAYPVFMDTLMECDSSVKEFGADWSLIEELSRDEATSRVNEVRFSMPLSCALQLALVRLLESWGVTPAAVTGHSSGEVAAAFAAGALDLREAMAATYFRGLVNAEHVAKNTLPGGMIAVGLGPGDVQRYLDGVTSGMVIVSCINSPSSVTLSGDMEGIDELRKKFEADGVFARKLKVQSAFHSHHMLPLEESYRSALKKHLRPSGRTLKQGVLYSSPVTGGKIEGADLLGPENWVTNMIQPVLFAHSFRNMIARETEDGLSQNIDAIVEIGPHSALAGPIRQSMSDPDLKNLRIVYGSCLERGKDAVLTMQTLAGFLLQRGYPVDVGQVNFPHKQAGLRAIPDLPSYPWNHSVRYWTESRMSHEHRFRRHLPHDLLGVQMPGTSDHSPIWRLILRASELPWVRDHVVQGNIVYPGSGYLCMAIEAMRQLQETEGKVITGYRLREVEISKALIIPENSDGVEVQLFFEPPDDQALVQGWRQFRVYSAKSQESKWDESARGMIAIEFEHRPAGAFAHNSTHLLDIAGTSTGTYPKKMNPADLFKTLHAIGIAHGPSFRNLSEIRMGKNKAITTYKIADSAATMPYNFQQPHVIHPITLDALFQAAYPALSPEGRKVVGTAVPRTIKALYISTNISTNAGDLLQQYSSLLRYDRQGFDINAAVVSRAGGTSNPVIELEAAHFQSVGRVDDHDESQKKDDLVLVNDWKDAFSLNDPSPLAESLRVNTAAPAEERAIAQGLARASYHFVYDTLQQLTEEDIANLEWYHKTFYDWMLLLEQQATNNELAPDSSRWAAASEEDKNTLYDQVSASSVNGELAVRMGKNLVRIMRKEVAPLELMLEGQLLHKLYQNMLHFGRSTIQAGEIVRAIAAENPRAHILEIGAGTGGCTIPVLTALGGGEEGFTTAQFEHYDFTDISAGFFPAARKRLAAWGNMINFLTLDIEQDPEKQGFQLGSYDIIIAAQVLHATKNMHQTMANVRKLLKDSGKLILIETTRDTPDMHLIFGNVPGWWLSEEPERKYSPNMPLASWEGILRGAGFSGLDINLWDCEEEDHQVMSCILSTAQPMSQSTFEGDVVLAYDGAQPPEEWIQGLITHIIDDIGVMPRVSDLASLDPTGSVCIFLSGLDGSPQVFDEARFDHIKSLLNGCKGLLWVTAGAAVDCTTPENALHLGLLRAARIEEGGKRYVSLDLDPARAAWTDASRNAIMKVLQAAFDFSKEWGIFDTEYAERDSRILVPRLHPDTEANEEFSNIDREQPKMEKFIQPHRSLRMYLEVPGLLDTITFRDDPDARLDLPDDWVEIEPKAFGLNFHTIMTAMGQIAEKDDMGVECAGVLTRVGPQAAARGFQVGDRVCALSVHGQFANRTRVPSVLIARISDDMTFEAAAAFVMTFVTAYFCLFDVGRIEEGETVLVHAASGGVGQACIILCQWKGIEVFATVGTQAKRDFLKSTYGLDDGHIFSSRDASFAEGVLNATGRRGVDIVINSLAGKLLHESWNVLAPHGRFVEIGKRDIDTNKSLEMGPFQKALSFTHVDVVQLADNKGRVVQRILREVLRLVESKTVRNISPVMSFPLADIARAFRIMQTGRHIGKLVVVPSKDDIVKVAPEPRAARLSPDATYMIVGGLTGIGRSIAWYFVDHGAKNLLLISRNAASRSATSNLSKELAATEARVLVKNCDVGNMEMLQSVLAECSDAGMPPIRGVVHGGMVLDDSIMERMSYSQWVTVMGPKLNGTQNLDKLFRDNVDFFILLSSANGILGSTSQANYAAAGSYQDALSRHRAALSLPAVTIDLGVVNSVGFVAEADDGVKDRLVKLGHRALEETEVLALVGSAIRNPRRTPRTAQLVTGIKGTTTGTAEPRFAGLRRPAGTTTSTSPGVTRGSNQREPSLHEQMTLAPSSAEATSLVERAIINKVAEMFVVPPADIDPTLSLATYGIDSLVAVELRNWLVPRARIEMSVFELLGSKSVRELAGRVVKKGKGVGSSGSI